MVLLHQRLTQQVQDRLYRAVSTIHSAITRPPTPPYQTQEHGSVLLQWLKRSRSLWMEQLLCFQHPHILQPAGNPPPPNPASNQSSLTSVCLRRLFMHTPLILFAGWMALFSTSHVSFLLCLCLAGINQGSCYRINHFPDDNDYDTDSSEYLLRECLTAVFFDWDF